MPWIMSISRKMNMLTSDNNSADAGVLRCIWCCRDTKTTPCEHCGSDQVSDRTKPHAPNWSRKTIRTVECKICGREIPYEQHGFAGDVCTPNAADQLPPP
jgi:hypothetical protein